MKKHNLDTIFKQYSEKELEENINLFNNNDWMWISSNQNISEEFIEKYQDKLHWNLVGFYQKISKEFIQKHIHKINFNAILQNKNISEEIKEEIRLLKEII